MYSWLTFFLLRQDVYSDITSKTLYLDKGYRQRWRDYKLRVIIGLSRECRLSK